MGFTIHILIVDDRKEYRDDIRQKISSVSDTIGSDIVVRSAKNLPDAIILLRDSGIEWDALITNLCLGDPSDKNVRRLGVNLAEAANDIGLTTVVVSAGTSGSVLKKLYKELKVYDFIFKAPTFDETKTFDELLNECFLKLLVDKVTYRKDRNYLQIHEKYNSVSLQAQISDITQWLAEIYDVQSCKRIIAEAGLRPERIIFQDRSSIEVWNSVIEEAQKHAFIPILEKLVNIAEREYKTNSELPVIKEKLISIKIKSKIKS